MNKILAAIALVLCVGAAHASGDATGLGNFKVRNASGTALAVYSTTTLSVSGSFSVGGSTVHVQNVAGSSMAVSAYQSGTWDEVGINDSGNSITVDGSSQTLSVAAYSWPVNGVVVSTNGTVLPIKTAAIASASSGQNVLVSTVASNKIRVLGMHVHVNAATDFYFTSGGSTVIWGGSTNKINTNGDGSGYVLPITTNGYWFETASGGSLEVNLSAANMFSGGLVYVEVP